MQHFLASSLFKPIHLNLTSKYHLQKILKKETKMLKMTKLTSFSPLIWVFLILTLAISTTHSQSISQEPNSENSFFNQTHISNFQIWQNLKSFQKNHMISSFLSPSMVITCILCFIASSISSAGGIGGGGLFVPILTIVAGFDLKTASSFSAFMVTGGSVANVLCQMVPIFGGKNLIDYDIALLSEPFMLLGVSIGVICNLVFPSWLITILFAVFLAWSTFKTCKSGFKFWKLESDEELRNMLQISENESLGVASCCDDVEIENTKEPLLGGETESTKEPLLGGEIEGVVSRIPWLKMGVLVIVWFSFFTIYLLRGNKYGEGIISIQPCGLVYWTLSALQIPIAIIFTTWILYRKDSTQKQTLNTSEKAFERCGPSSKLVFPVMALLAGVLGGVFGIGGGMLISPLLIQVGIRPEITAATCSFMVFFSSTMSAIQYLLLGMEHTGGALIFALVCFIASLIGLILVQRAIEKHGRVSLIVFSVSTVMALSAVLMTSFGALDIYKDYRSGKYMGFKRPC